MKTMLLRCVLVVGRALEPVGGLGHKVPHKVRGTRSNAGKAQGLTAYVAQGGTRYAQGP